MSQYRLHIDIPLGTDEADAVATAESIMRCHFKDEEAKEKIQRLTYSRSPLVELNYRLGHDNDRQKSNYLEVNENGHVNNKKSKMLFGGASDSNQISFEWVQ